MNPCASRAHATREKRALINGRVDVERKRGELSRRSERVVTREGLSTFRETSSSSSSSTRFIRVYDYGQSVFDIALIILIFNQRVRNSGDKALAKLVNYCKKLV